MEFTSTSSPSSSPIVHRHRKLKRFAVSLVVLLLIIGGVAGGFWYGQEKQKKDAPQPATAPTATPAPAPTPGTNAPAASTTHTVLSEGRLFDAGKPVAIKLAFPDFLQAVRSSSHNNNRGDEQLFTDKYNDELGRFLVGYPAYNLDATNISVLAISKSWLGLTQNATDLTIHRGFKVNTPDEKQQYLTKLKADTEVCAKDAAKGLAFADQNLKVCYTINPGIEDYSPILHLSGYGELAGQPVIMTGFLNIQDPKTMNLSLEDSRKVLSNAKTGNLPDSTKQVVEKITKALAQSTITVK